MLKKRINSSSYFVTIGVVLVTLVAGTTYSAYQRDLDLLQAEGMGTYATSLNGISAYLIRLEYDLSNYISSDGKDSAPMYEHASAFSNKLDELRASSEQYSKLPNEGLELFIKLEGFVDEVGDRIDEGHIAELTPKLIETDKIVSEVEEYVAAVTKSESLAKTQIQESLKSSSRNSILLSFLTVLLSILGMAHFIRLNSQNEVMARKNKKLAVRAEASSRAKSRLLTMLSHEIRTPMNGVLGLVSLGLQQKLPDGQKKLMERIQSSAMELITFLEDMLDFSNLDESNGRNNNSLLFTSNVTTSLKSRLKTTFDRYGKELSFVNDEKLPLLLKGDNDRIQQSLFYLLSYIAKNSFEQKVTVHSTLFEENWLWRIDLTSDEDTNENWQINSLVGETEGDKFIASDTIETAMARGLIESMQGESRLIKSNVQGNKYRLLIYIPIQTVESNRPLKIVKFPFGSDQIDLKSLLGKVAFEELEEHQLGGSQMILCDPKTDSELRKITDLRRAAPNAQLVSVGQTKFAELYDDVYFGQSGNALAEDNNKIESK